MLEQQEYLYDVFVSYSQADGDWVLDAFIPELEQAGFKVFIPTRDSTIGGYEITNIDRAVSQSRWTVLILTPSWLIDRWRDFEGILAQTLDPTGLLPRMLPLLLEQCELPLRLRALSYANFTIRSTRDKETARFVRRLRSKIRIFISYKPATRPDERLAKQLALRLRNAGYSVFIDDLSGAGVEWAQEIQRQIEASDFFIVLLSGTSVRSEMVAQEIEHAHKHHERTGRPLLLPVRIKYSDMLPPYLSLYLDHLQYAEWRGQQNNIIRVVKELRDFIHAGMLLANPAPVSDDARSRHPPVSAQSVMPVESIPAPEPKADTRLIEDSLSTPGGALQISSQVYIERGDDQRLRAQLRANEGTITTIRAPRQTGKSSLLLRGVAFARQQGNNVVFIDIQLTDQPLLQTLDVFLHYVAGVIVKELGLERKEFDSRWQNNYDFGAPTNMTDLMEKYILPNASAKGKKVVLAIDEADCLIDTSFPDNFFGMLRAWYNRRALNTFWNKLDILMVISTEPHFLIKNQNQSPFNVGLKINLKDFDEAQVSRLNERYGSPLEEHHISALIEFLGGHPYLTSQALYTLCAEKMTWEQLIQIAADERSPFDDHLRRYLWKLRDQPRLQESLKQVIHEQRCSDEQSFYQLLQIGLIKGTRHTTCMCRCKLYEQYFVDKLE